MTKKQTIVSGIQPTGNLHVGNYLGAVKHWVKLQNEGKYNMYIFIADLHSLTGDMLVDERREQIIKTAAELLAAGIDPEKTNMFLQSYIPEHTELAWIFDCLTPISELERMTQFKDKSARQAKNINAGLFTYPVLQAADILLYGGELVPVGVDQIQHVELTRDIARWFNRKYKKYFPETRHLLTKIPKVMSLLEPDKKMSKSLGLAHVIELADEPAVLAKKISKAVTSTAGGGKAPGALNLLTLLSEFAEPALITKYQKAEKDGTIRYGDLKKQLIASLDKYFADFRKVRKELLSDHDKIAQILIEGSNKARKAAVKTIEDVRAMVGVR